MFQEKYAYEDRRRQRHRILANPALGVISNMATALRVHFIDLRKGVGIPVFLQSFY